jgi:hypothetical protein
MKDESEPFLIHPSSLLDAAARRCCPYTGIDGRFEQRRVANLLQANRLVVVLKARQLGLSWLVLAFALWLMLFYPIATVLLFSRRDEEAADLLAVRLRGMYDRLPAFLQVRGFATDNDHEPWPAGRGHSLSPPRRAIVTPRRWPSSTRRTCASTSTG